MTKVNTATKKMPDIYTIGGLLNILGENIASINEDSSDANIKKSNAILQNVNAIKGIYSLALDKTRLDNLSHIKQLSGEYDLGYALRNNYFTDRELNGRVFGDDTERLKREHEADQEKKLYRYEKTIEKLKLEVEHNDENTDDEDFISEEYSKADMDILNNVLERSKKELPNEYAMCQYLLKHLKPSDFGVEE